MEEKKRRGRKAGLTFPNGYKKKEKQEIKQDSQENKEVVTTA